jgi:hypothetical protein
MFILSSSFSVEHCSSGNCWFSVSSEGGTTQLASGYDKVIQDMVPLCLPLCVLLFEHMHPGSSLPLLASASCTPWFRLVSCWCYLSLKYSRMHKLFNIEKQDSSIPFLRAKKKSE